MAEPDGSLTFRRWTASTVLRRSGLGVPEPVDTEDFPVGDLDVLVVPAVAVDRRGNRLGFGAGFYDRALTRRSRGALLVGAVHSVQVVDELEPEPWDVPLDIVVTEKGVLTGGGPVGPTGDGSGGT